MSAPETSWPVPVAHVDDPVATRRLLEALQDLHGPAYAFAVGSWDGERRLEPRHGAPTYRFLLACAGAAAGLTAGAWVRGVPPAGPYRPLSEGWAAGEPWAEATADHWVDLWPGDTLYVDEALGPVTVRGRALYFEVATEATPYRAPRLALLRYLPDRPGGCAAYASAFRREALPPLRPEPGHGDARGANRVNQHTLDMRADRSPLPIAHYHGPVPVGGGRAVNHSETALVLPRAAYGLPEMASPGRVVIYRRPADDPTDRVVVPVRPGSLIVTPATEAGAIGHRFENAFAMLVAIPGFVAPYRLIPEL